MRWHTEPNCYGRNQTLILNDRDEVEDAITGETHQRDAEVIAEDWNELWRDVGGEGG